MDIGQMGGGDKLFAKIDQGIRAAKVIICCVSKKYTQSDNCTREASVTNRLNNSSRIQFHAMWANVVFVVSKRLLGNFICYYLNKTFTSKKIQPCKCINFTIFHLYTGTILWMSFVD